MSQLKKAKKRALQYVVEANMARAEKKEVLPVILLGNEAGEIELNFNTAGLEDMAADMVRLLAARLGANYALIGGEAFTGKFAISEKGVPIVPKDFEPEEDQIQIFLCIETRNEEDCITILDPKDGVFPTEFVWKPHDRKRPAVSIDGGLIDLIPPLDVVANCQDTISLEGLLSSGQNAGLYERISIDEGMGTWMRKDELLRAARPDPGAAN